jgi:osmotically-inducible protein OsmY
MFRYLAILSLLTLFSCASGAKKESTGEYIDSAAVTAKIKGLYVKDKRLSALDVKVETYKGHVQLSGFVDKPSEKQAAEEIAESLVGVKSVTNNIIIRKD